MGASAGDYYSPGNLAGRLGARLGWGPIPVRLAAEAISPFKLGLTVSAVWGGMNSLINARKYKQSKITKREAIIDTAGQSAGMGVASALGLLASNAARTSILVASTSSLIPLIVGIVVTAGAKGIWDYGTKRQLKIEGN